METDQPGGENAADFRDALLRRQAVGIDGIKADTGRIGHGMETVRYLMLIGGR